MLNLVVRIVTGRLYKVKNAFSQFKEKELSCGKQVGKKDKF
jgi:hypothetical protein